MKLLDREVRHRKLLGGVGGGKHDQNMFNRRMRRGHICLDGLENVFLRNSS